MSTVYPTLPRLSVRDSFDEDDLSDVDDEVFIRDGKNSGGKHDEDRGVKRPLMAPRRKTKTCKVKNSQQLPYKALLTPFCYGLLALLVLLGLIVICIYTVNLFPIPLNILKKWLSGADEKTLNITEIVPCTSLASSVLWTRTLPKFTSEAPFRSNDVNDDNIDDIIVGFSTGLDAMDAQDYLCDLYFGGQRPCLGGIMALDGKTGSTIWIHWTEHAIFNVDCGMDLTSDDVEDCLITGRGGILHAVDGKDGTTIWKFGDIERELISSGENGILDVYDVTYINDIDNDKICDIVASHTVQSGDSLNSEIIVISGKTGSIIGNVDFPRNEELFIAPRPLVHPDGEIILVLVSSTPKKSGGLYVISYSDLIHGNLRFHELYWGAGRGILLPPIFADVTSDGTEDIVIATVNATIMAFDGLTLRQIWNYTVENSEIISIPIPGYYNDDDVPDFMVKHQIGPGYPLYYYTVSTILDGKNGSSLLEKSMSDTMSGQMSGLSLSVEDYGNDWFLHWSSDCLNHEDSHDHYRFLKNQNLLSQSRADLCKLRFNATLVTKLWALSQHVGPPGQPLYNSEDWKFVEYNNSVDPRQEADRYRMEHPEFDDESINDRMMPLVSERSPKFEKSNRKKISNFRHKSNGKDDDDDEDEESQNYSVKKINDNGENFARQNSYDNNPDDVNYEMYRDQKNFPDEKLRQDNWIEAPDWREKNLEKQYDAYDDENVEMSRLNDVREQRSDTSGYHNVGKNDSTDGNNQYDPDMDYTNGGGNNARYSINYDDETSKLDVDERTRKRPGIGNSEDTEKSEFSEYEDIENERESTRDEDRTKRSGMSNDRKSRGKRRNWDDNPRFVKGIQRQPPTGILLPSIAPSTTKTSVDLIFSTYWLPPSEISVILLQRDLDCIKSKREKKNDVDNDVIIMECLAERGVNYNLYQESISRENVKIQLGQMTIYRMKLECVCPDDMLPGQACKNISQRQTWPAHLGKTASGYFSSIRNN